MIVNKPDQQTYRTQIVAARINKQNADENLILEGTRGVINKQDLVTSLASDPKLFAPDPKHPEDAKVDVNFKSPDAVNFDHHLKQALKLGQYDLIGNDSFDYGIPLPIPNHVDDCTKGVMTSLNFMTVQQKAALHELRGVKTNQALIDNLVDDPQISTSHMAPVKGFTPGLPFVIDTNLKDIIATKDPAINNPFPGPNAKNVPDEQRVTPHDRRLPLMPDAPLRRKIATEAINDLNSVQLGVVRAQRGVKTNAKLVRNMIKDDSLFQYTDEHADDYPNNEQSAEYKKSWQEYLTQDAFKTRLEDLATAPAIHLRDARQVAHQEAHQEAQNTEAEPAEPYDAADLDDTSKGNAVGASAGVSAVDLNMSDLGDAPTEVAHQEAQNTEAEPGEAADLDSAVGDSAVGDSVVNLNMSDLNEAPTNDLQA